MSAAKSFGAPLALMLCTALAAPACAPSAQAQNLPAPVQPAPAQPGQAVPTPTPAINDAIRASDGFVQVAAAVLPAVVSIRVESRHDEPDIGSFFGMPGMPFGGRRRGGPEIVRGTGSGVLIRADGVVVTNNHVVEGAQRILVHLRDGRLLRGRVLGTDAATDLALVKIEGQGFPVVRWGNSDGARVGEWVLAVGAPFGLEATVTHGVVSAKGRAGIGANQIEDYLQTDASINPGNSGGPLVNLRGEVLGINTMIVGRGSGVGFAVPSGIARTVADQLLAHGRVTRGWIGVGVQNLTPELAQQLHLAPDSGALISQVETNAPAARAGLRTGDVITAVDGRAVERSSDVVRDVTIHAPGDRVALTVRRGSQTLNIPVIAGRRPDQERNDEPGGGPGAQPDATGSTLGLGLQGLPRARQQQLGVDHGVLVANVAPGSPADDAGLQPGDVILQANGTDVRNPPDVQRALRSGRGVLLVRRGNQQIFVPIGGQ